MEQLKWFRSDRDVKICDVILFIKNEGSVVNTYQYRMDHETELSRDGLIWKVVIKYRNSSENIDRFTTRAVRELVWTRYKSWKNWEMLLQRVAMYHMWIEFGVRR